MKRDFDLIRLILMEQESYKSSAERISIAINDSSVPASLSAHSRGDIIYNINLMKEAGLIDAVISKNGLGTPNRAIVLQLTWAGHDFLDAARNDSTWRKAKEKVMAATASFTFGILTEYLKYEIKQRIPGLEARQ